MVVSQKSMRQCVVINMTKFSLLADGDTFADLLLLCHKQGWKSDRTRHNTAFSSSSTTAARTQTCS